MFLLYYHIKQIFPAFKFGASIKKENNETVIW